ncbi:MAG: glycosyl hydrolase [Verrucomicrobiia bacterium]
MIRSKGSLVPAAELHTWAVVSGIAAAGAVMILLATSARADAIEDGFRHPPDSARPQTWWHWMNGNITKEGITADLEAMQRVGIGGATIVNVDCGIPAGPVKFLSPEWRELAVHAAREADRLGLELCLENCAGWSSSGGPWNTPEHAMQRVTTSERKVKGPVHFSAVLPSPPSKLDYYRDLAVLAFRTPDVETGTEKSSAIEDLDAKSGANGEFVLSSPAKDHIAAGQVVPRAGILDLTSQLHPDGRLDWEVPAGDWTILRLGYTPTGVENHPAPAEGTGPECDKFSPEALDAHWAGFVQKVLDDLGPLAGSGKTLNNVLIDSYEVGGQNWTPQFRSEFQKRRGYDPLLYLPTLTGRVVDSPEVSERFLWDLRRTIADLFAENYYGHFQELCHEHGLKASFEPYTGPFESLQCGATADIPMGEFWVGGAPDASVKLAASIGHIYGRPVIGAESFTASPGSQHGRWLDDPYSLKALGDQVFCQGVNRFIFHRYALQPWTNRWPGMTMGQWGTHFDRTCTWWEQSRAWFQYVARCQYLLQQGRFVADAAYFCGESAPVEMRAGDPAMPPGYDYDAINADVLLHHATMKADRLVLDRGMSYRVLILPPSDPAISPDLLRKLAEFVADGLIVVGQPPRSSPSLEGYPECDVEVRTLATRIWGDCNGGTITEHAHGRGKAVWGRPLAQVFGGLKLEPDFDYPAADGTRLDFIHRRDGETEMYFVSNQRNRFATVDCSFRVEGKQPELWNPETGDIEPAPVWHEENGRTVVRLPFGPSGSVFVVFRAKTQGDHLVAVECDGPPLAEASSQVVDLRILKAVYGAFPVWIDVTASVKSLVADGERHISAGNDLAGEDPASGTVKQLRVEFIHAGRHEQAEATEGESIGLPAGSEVVKALYGCWPGVAHPPREVTANVKALVAGGTREIRADNGLTGNDPAPNVVKQLRVEYRLNNRRQTVEVTENKTLELPEGAEVEQAIYGQLHPPARSDRLMDLTAKLSARVKPGGLSARIDNDFAGDDPAPNDHKELHVEYTLNGIRQSTVVKEDETLTLPETALPAGTPPPYVFLAGTDQMRLLALAPGNYTLRWASGRKTKARCPSVPAPFVITGSWDVSFPPGWNAPAKVTFEQLQSWTKNADSGVKYFSGTATYTRDVNLPADLPGSRRELWLDLGAVKNLAEVSLNGNSLGILWKPPFRVNVTAVARPGPNTLEVKVTNLWPNRLIGDEQLAPDCEWKGKELKGWPQWLLDGKPSPTGRVTFTTWHHWGKDAALLDSGLLGPVTVQAAEEITFR